MKLTSRERILRIFKNQEIDRPSLKLWGAGPVGPQLHDKYLPVSKLAFEVSDLFVGCGFPFDIYAGSRVSEFVQRYTEPTDDPTWNVIHTVFNTPKGKLHMSEHVSTIGEPSYTVEYLLKTPEDIECLLSLPYEPFSIDRKGFDRLEGIIGDRGVVMPSLDHAGYALQRLTGSENLAFFSMDCRELLCHAVKIFADRIYEHTQNIINLGIKAPFSWVGPEVFLPPLMSPNDFDDFVLSPDKRLCDLIHDSGNYVWVHSHGRVANFIEKFIDMGVDVLNPLEPPKNGDVIVDDVVAVFGNKIALEGNIEIQELIQSDQSRIKELIDCCVEAGAKSGRFILCPSAGYMEYPNPSDQYIQNLMFYLNYGLESVERYRK